MSNKNTVWQNIAIIILAVLLCFAIAELRNLSEELSSAEARFSNELNSLYREIEEIYDNVDSELKKQASLLSGVEYTLGSLDTAANTAEVEFKIVPKTVTEDMQVTVEYGGKTASLTKNGGTFTGILPVKLFSGYGEYPLMTVTSGGTATTEYLETVDLSYLHNSYLPILIADSPGGTTFSDGKVTFDGGVILNTKHSSDDGSVAFVKYELVTEKNGTEIHRQDITADVIGGTYEVDITGSYPAIEGDEVAVYAVAEDSLGYIHKALGHYWKEENGAVAEVVEAGEVIYDKDGNRLN